MAVILGIDPGSRITGYGVIDMAGREMKYIASGAIRITAETTAERLQQVFSGIREVVSQYQPIEAAIEEIFMHQNPKGTLKLGQARGVALVAASLDGLPIAEYTAKQIKQAVVGYGAAAKEQVQAMVQQLLHLSGKPQADAADALAVAICHGNTGSRNNFK